MRLKATVETRRFLAEFHLQHTSPRHYFTSAEKKRWRNKGASASPYIGLVVETQIYPIASKLLPDISMMKKTLYLKGKNSEKLFSMCAPHPPYYH